MDFRQAGHGPHPLNQPAHTRCGLSSWEHRGLGFVCFGLEHVKFEGEGGSSQEVHKHKGNLNQKTTVHKTSTRCPERCQFAGKQLQ